MPEYFIALGKQTLFLALILTGPPVLTALMVGLTISVLQATTQVQEQTLTFVPKIVAMLIAGAFFMPYILNKLTSFATEMFSPMPIP